MRELLPNRLVACALGKKRLRKVKCIPKKEAKKVVTNNTEQSI